MPGIYYRFGFLAQTGSCGGGLTKHVARRNLRSILVRHQFFGLRALAGAGRAKQYDAHFFVPNYEIAQVRYRQ